MNLKWNAVILALAAVWSTQSAWAALPYEIQVYDDSINKPGVVGYELHLNTTPSGQLPEYPGEVGSMHAWRSTLELSYGLTETLEPGLYLPVVNNPDGVTNFAGPSFRLKWIPHRAPEDGGLFYGVNTELTFFKRRYVEEQNVLSLQPILGYRTPEWLVITNPTLDYPVRAGYREGGPGFTPSFKVSRTVAPGVASGFEYYADFGPLMNIASQSGQSHTLFLVVDVNRAPWVFNLGIGRGFAGESDRWTIKSIFELPFN